MPYSYEAFIIAARYFPKFGDDFVEENGGFTREEINRRDVAGFLAHKEKLLLSTETIEYLVPDFTHNKFNMFFINNEFHIFCGAFLRLFIGDKF